MRRSLAAAAAAVVMLAGAAIAASQPAPITGTDGPDRLVGTRGADTMMGERGPDRLEGGAGDDIIAGGPGYDTLLGGPGDDRLTDGSHGSDRIDGGPGDDVIRSAPRGMDRVRCGAGRDRVEADLQDIVGTDCETVVRAPRGEDAHVPVLSARGELIGHTGTPRLSEEPGPLRLLWASAGNLFLATPFEASGYCFVSITPGVITGACSPRTDTGGSLFVRGSRATGFRWFAFTPTWADAVTVGARRFPVVDGIAVFVAGRRPGLVVAVGDGRALRLRTP